MSMKSNEYYDFLKKIFDLFFENKMSLLITSLIFASLFYGLAFFMPEKYISKAVIAESMDSSEIVSETRNLSATGGFFNLGLAPTGPTKFQEALKISKSRELVLSFLSQEGFLDEFASGVEKDSITKYEKENAYQKFLTSFAITRQADNFYEMSMETTNPELSYIIVSNYIDFLNDYLKQKDIEKYNSSSEYLLGRIKKETNLELRDISYKIVEEHLKKITLIEGSKEYVINTIDSAYLPLFKSSPNTIVLTFFGFFLGLLLSFSFIAFRRN